MEEWKGERVEVGPPVKANCVFCRLYEAPGAWRIICPRSPIGMHAWMVSERDKRKTSR